VPTPHEEPYAGTEVDLTQEDGPQLELQGLSADSYDPNPKREQVRGTIAWFLLGLLTMTILFAFIAVAFQWTAYDNIKDMLGILLPPIVGLVGSAMGFYFGRSTD
jgi:hypothetical protein|tara:strand:- start:2770 stop:3084 length:315 start_codon:yes stop_codon:yes gene_type:complete